MPLLRVLDLAFSRLEPAGDMRRWFERRRAEGYVAFFQNLWTGGYANNDRLRAVARDNLHDGRQAGLTPCAYTNASPWREPALWRAETLLNARDELQHLRAIAVDVEIGVPNRDGALRLEANVATYLAMWAADGLPTLTYSADWYVGLWRALLRHLPDFGRPYWYARYDGVPALDVPTHPLGPVAGKQYAGTTDIEGVAVDLNVFDPTLLPSLAPKEDDIMTPAQEAKLDQIIALLGQGSAFGQGTLPDWINRVLLREGDPAANDLAELIRTTQLVLREQLIRNVAGPGAYTWFLAWGDSGMVHVVVERQRLLGTARTRHYVPSMATFTALGFVWASIRTLPVGETIAIREGLPLSDLTTMR